jgi:hypothetical protein
LGVSRPSSSPGANSTTNNAAKTNPYTKAVSRLCLCRGNKINAEDFENVFETYKGLCIVIPPVDIKRIGASYQVPFQFVKERNLIRQQPVKMMLRMKNSVKPFRVTVPVIRRQLKTVEVVQVN